MNTADKKTLILQRRSGGRCWKFNLRWISFQHHVAFSFHSSSTVGFFLLYSLHLEVPPRNSVSCGVTITGILKEEKSYSNEMLMKRNFFFNLVMKLLVKHLFKEKGPNSNQWYETVLKFKLYLLFRVEMWTILRQSRVCNNKIIIYNIFLFPYNYNNLIYHFI